MTATLHRPQSASPSLRECFQTLYLPVCCQEEPPHAPPLKRGEHQVLVPLGKGDLGGSPGLKTRLSVPASATREIVFIDSAVTDYPDLVAGVRSRVEVIVLDAMRDGVEQISEVLAQRQDLTAVHLVSHGSPGRVQLGATELSLETVNRYAWQLEAWAEALTDAAELLIYGCEVAKGDRGRVFVNMLHTLTGANVAASAVITGCAAQGGNWALETSTAPSVASLAFTSTVLEQYAATLSNEPIQYNINLVTDSSNPSHFTDINGTLYFSAYNNSNGYELWKIDPTTGNPVRVTDIEAGSASSYPVSLTNVNGTLYFRAYNSSNGAELWKIDPTTGNAVRVTDIELGSGSSYPSNLTNVNGTLYFSATNDSNGPELWKIDPATGNPLRFEIEAGSGSSYPYNLTNINGTLYFSAYNSSIGNEVWKIDPATGNLSSIDVNTQDIGSNPSNLTNVNGTLYFSATNGSNGTELWKIDSTTGNPVRVTDIEPGSGSSYADNLTNVNGTLYFSAYNSSNYTELWRINPN